MRPTTTERRYKALIEASTSVVWRADRTGSIVEAWGWTALTNQPHLGYLGQSWLDALHPDDRGPTIAHWRDALAKGKLAPIEYRIGQPDGSWRWAKARGVALRDRAGQVTEWVGTVTDVHERRQAEQSLREHEELLRLAVEATGLGVWEMELPSHQTRWSPELNAMAGRPADAPIDDDLFYSLVHPDDRVGVEEKITAAASNRDTSPYEAVYRLRRVDTGEERWWHEWSRLVMDSGGQPARVVGAIQDITGRKRTELERVASEERWRLALQAGRMVAWERNVATGMTTRSANAAELLGLPSGDVSGFLANVHPLDRARLGAFTRNPTRRSSAFTQFRYRHPDGRTLWLETRAMLIDGDVERVVGVTADVTEKKAAETRLRYAATHDPLTGLLNRVAIQGALTRAIRRARRLNTSTALLLLDVDQFKDVNDTLGHDAGDHLLRVAAERLSAIVGPAGLVARLGGDEFAIVLQRDAPAAVATVIATSILRALAEPFAYRASRLSIGASIGIAVFPAHETSSVELFKNADLALYAAKNEGRQQVKEYDIEMRLALERRVALVADLKQAIGQGLLVPFYQPKVDMRTGAIVGFEALARWTHPTRGVLGPQHFGSAFDDPELAVAIGDAMVAQVLRDVAGWLGDGIECGRIAVNFSSHAFSVAGLPDSLGAQLERAGVPPARFEIEVTETVFLDGDAANVAIVLKRFHDMGIRISLDDFGTGYASLTHLKRFPVDEIKIDRSFIRDLEEDPDNAAIVSAVIGLGRSLGLKVVAEGIETEGQEARLRSWGCDFGQGYLYAKPMAASRVPWLIRNLPKRAPPALAAPRPVRASS